MPKKSTVEDINKKQALHKARVTTFLRGSTKNKFFEEIKRTGCAEWELANEIIVKHYK